MTAILDDMRRLDAAHARGEMTAAELAARKARLLDAVPEVLPESPAGPAARASPRPARTRRPGIGQALLLCTLILSVCCGVTLLITGDIMLSMTLAITVLAACTVMLFRQLDG